MSQFASKEDLYEAKAEYYKNLVLSPAHKDEFASLEDFHKEQADYYQAIVIAAEEKEANDQRLLLSEQKPNKQMMSELTEFINDIASDSPSESGVAIMMGYRGEVPLDKLYAGEQLKVNILHALKKILDGAELADQSFPTTSPLKR